MNLDFWCSTSACRRQNVCMLGCAKDLIRRGGAIYSPPKYAFTFLKPASFIKVLKPFLWFTLSISGFYRGNLFPLSCWKTNKYMGRSKKPFSEIYVFGNSTKKTFLQYKYLLETWTILILAVSVLSSRTIQLLGIELNFRISIKLICTPTPVMHSFYRICAQG